MAFQDLCVKDSHGRVEACVFVGHVAKRAKATLGRAVWRKGPGHVLVCKETWRKVFGKGERLRSLVVSLLGAFSQDTRQARNRDYSAETTQVVGHLWVRAVSSSSPDLTVTDDGNTHRRKDGNGRWIYSTLGLAEHSRKVRGGNGGGLTPCGDDVPYHTTVILGTILTEQEVASGWSYKLWVIIVFASNLSGDINWDMQTQDHAVNKRC